MGQHWSNSSALANPSRGALPGELLRSGPAAKIIDSRLLRSPLSALLDGGGHGHISRIPNFKSLILEPSNFVVMVPRMVFSFQALI